MRSFPRPFRRFTPFLAILLALSLGALQEPLPQVPPSQPGSALIRQMREKYAGRWYRTLTAQKTATFRDGRRQEWYETIQVPGLRRLDIMPRDSLNGIIFRNDSLYEFTRGNVSRVLPFVHALTLLSRDLYGAPPEYTIHRLQQLGFDLTRVLEDRWQERAVWVVGADSGDRNTSQIWIDKERLVLVRLIEQREGWQSRSPDEPAQVQETWLEDYARIGGGWAPRRVRYFKNGVQFLTEVYVTLTPDSVLSPSRFLPDRLRTFAR